MGIASTEYSGFVRHLFDLFSYCSRSIVPDWTKNPRNWQHNRITDGQFTVPRNGKILPLEKMPQKGPETEMIIFQAPWVEWQFIGCRRVATFCVKINVAASCTANHESQRWSPSPIIQYMIYVFRRRAKIFQSRKTCSETTHEEIHGVSVCPECLVPAFWNSQPGRTRPGGCGSIGPFGFAMYLGLAVELDITCLLGALAANLSCMVVYTQAMWINPCCYEWKEREADIVYAIMGSTVLFVMPFIWK